MILLEINRKISAEETDGYCRTGLGRFLLFFLILTLFPAIQLPQCLAADLPVKDSRARSNATSSSSANVTTAFGSDCERLLIKEISRAKEEMFIAIYSITRRNIVNAISQAAKRKVKIIIKYDAQTCLELESMQQAIDTLKECGIKCMGVEMGDEFGKMHHKFIVIDGKRVLTGSFNYTSSGSAVSYENLVSIESSTIAENFLNEFYKIKSR